jgi:hypothetical protein
MSRKLDEKDSSVIRACLHAVVDGPFFPDWEFPSLFPFSRQRFAEISARFPELDVEVCVAINSAFNNLLRYPHGHRDDGVWQSWIPLSTASLKALEQTWAFVNGSERLRPKTVKVIAGPAVNYKGTIARTVEAVFENGGLLRAVEVWQDGKWGWSGSDSGEPGWAEVSKLPLASDDVLQDASVPPELFPDGYEFGYIHR